MLIYSNILIAVALESLFKIARGNGFFSLCPHVLQYCLIRFRNKTSTSQAIFTVKLHKSQKQNGTIERNSPERNNFTISGICEIHYVTTQKVDIPVSQCSYSMYYRYFASHYDLQLVFEPLLLACSHQVKLPLLVLQQPFWHRNPQSPCLQWLLKRTKENENYPFITNQSSHFPWNLPQVFKCYFGGKWGVLCLAGGKREEISPILT